MTFQVVEPGSLSEIVWDEKYRLKDADGNPIDIKVEDTFMRVAKALAACERRDSNAWAMRFFDAMRNFEFLPAGRILAGAGTSRDVTLINCYVSGTIEDSLSGIMNANKDAALTLKQGGGIGMDFSTLRPRGARVKGVDSVSSGAVSFMDMWHTMCGTIMSAGSRRGAMMGTLRIDHPDVEEFIKAKQTKGRLTNFNVSVLVTDAFMEAVANCEDWNLVFGGEVYKTVKAQDLWVNLLNATYEYAEPGVIFIDRVNKLNPLNEVETICASNPCGEQMLPPHGACVLSSINLARLVRDPFTVDATLDYARLVDVARLAVRFLDNVIETTKFPLRQQEAEARNKRRIGLGVTGVADALIMLGLKYDESAGWVQGVMEIIEENAMMASIHLANERGAYPIWEESQGPKRRNSHLMSIAPTGTISCFAGNVSSGIEPVFDYEYTRKMLMPDGSHKTIECVDYAVRVARSLGVDLSKDVLQIATELTPLMHVEIAAAAQKHVDSAISKTINCPMEMSFEDFVQVYDAAYRLGMKGCTTYRPSGVRGSVLEKKTDDKPAPLPSVTASEGNVVQLQPTLTRPKELVGKTYKVVPGEHALYITINDIEDQGRVRPFEIFFSSKEMGGYAWTVALSRMISAIFRKGGDVSFVADELKSIFDPRGGFWLDGKLVPSVCAAIGNVIEKHMVSLGAIEHEEPVALKQAVGAEFAVGDCPKCITGTLKRSEGCQSCDSCMYSKCG